MTELYRQIVGFEGLYEVSNFGNVKSLEKIRYQGSATQIYRERVMKQETTYKGYCRVMLSKYGVKSKHYVHRLVAEAFLENIENKKQVNHKNCIKSDNTLENLEWVTFQENRDHCIAFYASKVSFIR